MEKKKKVGIVGCGNILGQYVQYSRSFEILEIVACTDIIPEKAQAAAAEFDIPRVLSVEALMADPDVDIVLNLTVPNAHAQVNLAAIAARKHIYSEKPLATSREDGSQIMSAAQSTSVRVGCAPDTFLGGGLQTCRKLIDEGWIGHPVAATAFMMGSGPESWHPNPAFFYQPGAGPLFDMGPYYLTALVHLLGPIKQVAAASRISFPERIATSPAIFGQHIPVEVPTFVSGLLTFTGGPIGVLVTTFDVKASELPRIEVYGSEGTLSVPDPNTFAGPVRVHRAGAEAWSEIPLTHSGDVGRGIGLADMATGLADGRPHRASGEMAFHVLELMEAIAESSQRGSNVEIRSTCARPQPLPMGLLAGRLDG